VATASAAAALLAVLPLDAPATATATAAGPVVTAPVVTAPVVTAPVVTAAVVPPPVVTAAVAPVASRTAAASTGAARRSSAVELALGKVGSPYRWGGAGPRSFDCSGLVNWAFDQVGVDLPRTSRALSRTGAPVARGDLRPGDLVFFYSPVSHVGIYIGGGRMVHASTSGRPVAVADIADRPYHSARRI
jgi:cell wall-associated NlpC family hydrolase